MRTAWPLLPGFCLIAGCATLVQCPPTGFVALQCRAEKGDKLAQLELGLAYERGHGVAQNDRRAAQLYRAAAAPVSGTAYIYSPPVGRSRGQVIPVRTGADQAGLAEAKYRLGLLYQAGRGVRRDVDRAKALIVEARRGGYPPD